MHVIEGTLTVNQMKIGIVAGRFNELVTAKLVDGAMDGLIRHGVADEDISVVWVPGAFEIPLVAERMAEAGTYDGIICLGAVIRGETGHYNYVCNEVAKGIAQVAFRTKRPVIFGVLTTENLEQALERSGAKAGNKGYKCAMDVIEMVNLLRNIDKGMIGGGAKAVHECVYGK